ncbi:DUF11 domain-containing protein [uncultured Roseovarius sp.]|uniref:DUF11 domain-containing protein n=1 Tax=uncultured Roseovarius sp. TaxID=293344 RepID=UPI002626AD37|nr:DUF11 domain-containing protein [uncultured Roseovarius sp.]
MSNRFLRVLCGGTLAIAALSAPEGRAGEFTLDWAEIDWPAGSTAPLTATLTDQYGFEVDATISVTGTFGFAGGINSPDDTTLLGGGVPSLGFISDAPANLGRVGDATVSSSISFSSNGFAFPVDGLVIDILDVDAGDANGTSDSCDFVTVTGSSGDPTLSAVSSSPTFVVGPGPGSGLTGPLDANQAQCVFLDGPLASPTSNNDDTGTVRATFPDNTASVSTIFDESIGNVRTLLSYDPAARGIGVLASSSFSVGQSISLVKTSDPGEIPAPGTTITYTYVVTNDGSLPFNIGQDIVIADESVSTVTCPAITAEVPVGGSVTCTAEYTATVEDVLNGSLSSEATAGIGPIGQPFDDRLQSDPATLTLLYALGFDFGDAPVTYLAPSHALVSAPTIYLGNAASDAEAFTQSDATATGDDLAGTDDEDAVALPLLTQGTIVTVTVDVAGDGYLQAWMDFNGNGLFDASSVERLATDLRDDGTGDDIAAGDGEIQIRVAVPDDATTSLTFGRFRWASQSGLGVSQPTLDGEVEDYSFVIAAADLVDRGDAPASYGDPRHIVVPTIYLGATLPDTETTPQYSADAQGDDIDGIDDEDATTFPTLVAGTTMPLTVLTHETLSLQYDLGLPVLVPGITNLQLWIDYDQNGTFDSDEQVAVNYRDGGTGDTDGAFNNQIVLNIPVPADIASGTTYARLRWSTTSVLSADPFDGLNLDGEVEDYRVTLENPISPEADLSLDKIAQDTSGVPISATTAGTAFDFVLTVNNSGPAPATGVRVRDLIPSGFAYVSDDAASQGDSYDADTGIWDLGDVPSGSSPALTLRVTMRDTGEHTNAAEIVASDLPDPDSDPASGALVDDLADGLADDDEASAAVAYTRTGATLSGRVFVDNGATAYDGIQGADETVTSRAVVDVYYSNGTLIGSSAVTADGSWSLALPDGYADAVTVSVVPDTGLRPVSENTAALPGLVNTDPRDGNVTFSPVVGTSYDDLNFGVIVEARLNLDQQAAIRPGQVVSLRHEYLADAPGTVNFSVASETKGSPGAFSTALFLDGECDGTADTPLTNPLTIEADTLLCIVARVSASSAVRPGASYSFDLVADTTYGSFGLTESDRNTDRVTVDTSQGALKLTKTVRNLTQGTAEGVANAASAGDVLEYRIYLQNTGSVPSSDIVIYDSTPPYTMLANGVPSPVSLGADVTCANATAGANTGGYVGSLQWDCTGLYQPGSEHFVTFQVRIAP